MQATYTGLSQYTHHQCCVTTVLNIRYTSIRSEAESEREWKEEREGVQRRPENEIRLNETTVNLHADFSMAFPTQRPRVAPIQIPKLWIVI